MYFHKNTLGVLARNMLIVLAKNMLSVLAKQQQRSANPFPQIISNTDYYNYIIWNTQQAS